MSQSLIKILGIDPGTAKLGWGLIEYNKGNIIPLKYGCIETLAGDPMPKRLAKIYGELSDIIERDRPEQVAIEELFYFKNAKTVITVAQARGAAIICAANMGLAVYEYTPLQIKQALTGYGRADKYQVQEMVRITFKLDHRPKPDDAADALAVAITHAQSVSNNKRTEKQKNRGEKGQKGGIVGQIFRFREFPVYKEARQFRRKLKGFAKNKFPEDEKYCLLSQLFRALDSILLNIAEGSERYSDTDFSRFLNTAIGSLAEVIACLDAALDDKYITIIEFQEFLAQAEGIVKQLKAFSAKVRNSK